MQYEGRGSLLQSKLTQQTATTKLHPGDKTEYRPLQRMALVVRQRIIVLYCSILFYIVLDHPSPGCIVLGSTPAPTRRGVLYVVP